jgi:tetratricopeptide (TPR) repeat protein
MDSFLVCEDGPVTQAYISRVVARNLVKAERLDEAHAWFQRSVALSDEREGWFYYAEFLYSIKSWQECYLAAKRCLKISSKRDGFTYDQVAWGFLAFDYAAIAAWHLGDYEAAAVYGERALEMEPDNQRLKDNLEWYKNGK